MTENAPGFAEERLPENAFSMRFGRLIIRNRFATRMLVRRAFVAASLSEQTEQPKVETARQAAAGGA